MNRSVFILLGLVASSYATLFLDCGSQGTDVTMDVEGCTEPPCILERGSSYLVNFKYTSSVNTDSLTISATANIGGINVPWPDLDPNACAQLENSPTPCPIAAGSYVDWTMSADVLAIYPTIETLVTFQLLDASGNPQTCAKLTAIIV
ncbi:hypothetical protein SK128_017860 [Halocaridina rubra]|uniref:MD-2-related lipid-recognition domain-containing protein n=1 Tax=Halocaridina rubra TaxID=373956 RepID=A0AAN8ZVS0_HALRR